MRQEEQMDTKAMYKLSYGLFVITVKEGKKANGCIANTAVQVASNPNTISVSLGLFRKYLTRIFLSRFYV
ncbi:MAG: hypothetical protein IJ682_14225 [Lachnospiraceae bacterium]|nr:hypothetical protein [Lachnospiraceae bacterium]